IGVADAAADRLQPLERPPVGVLAVPGESLVQLWRRRETLPPAAAGDLDLELDALQLGWQVGAGEHQLQAAAEVAGDAV
ncbi:hypothetical protein DF186_24655, partial [Enterococcus hirae]